MDASAPAKSESRILNIGIYQWIALAFAFLFGAVSAFQNGAWRTLFGAAAGVLLGEVLERILHRVLSTSFVRRHARDAQARLSSAVLGVARNTLSSESYGIFSRATLLWGSLWSILAEESPATAHRTVLIGLCRSPIKFSGWFVIGIVMQTILQAHQGLLGDPASHELFGGLDLAVGALVMISALQAALYVKDWDAISVTREIVPARLAERLADLTSLPGKRGHESRQELASLRKEVLKNTFRIGDFTVRGSELIEEVFNLVIQLAVLIYLAPFEGATVLIGTLFVIAMRFDDLLRLSRADKETVVLRAELNSAELFGTDQAAQDLLYAIADPATFASSLKGKREAIRTIKNSWRISDAQRNLVALIVFFTLFSQSAVGPFFAACSGEMQVRVATLYFFSLVLLWRAVSTVARSASRMVESMDKLSQVETALAAIAAGPHDPEDGVAVPEGGLSARIEFVGTRFRYRRGRTFLAWRGKVTQKATVAEAQVVRVLGLSGLGNTTVLKLIAGQLLPEPDFKESLDPEEADAVDRRRNRHSVLIGGVSTADLDMWRWVKLIPDTVPENLNGNKIDELFRAVCGPAFEDAEISRILADFGLLNEIEVPGDKYSGIHLLIGPKGRPLTDQQQRVLFLALHYAALKCRLKDRGSFKPSVIAVDGIAKIATLAQRKQISAKFQEIAGKFCCTYVVVSKDVREVVAKDEYVLTIVDPEDLPDPYADFPDALSVLGGVHGDRWDHTDGKRKSRYQGWQKELQERY